MTRKSYLVQACEAVGPYTRKHKKNRYVPMYSFTLRRLKEYIDASAPKMWLFNGKVRGTKMSEQGIRHAVNQCVAKTGIQPRTEKKV